MIGVDIPYYLVYNIISERGVVEMEMFYQPSKKENRYLVFDMSGNITEFDADDLYDLIKVLENDDENIYEVTQIIKL